MRRKKRTPVPPKKENRYFFKSKTLRRSTRGDVVVQVSDHAVVRYLERIEGIDVEKIRETIAKNVAPAVEAGATAWIKDGMKYELREGIVITVYEKRHDNE